MKVIVFKADNSDDLSPTTHYHLLPATQAILDLLDERASHFSLFPDQKRLPSFLVYLGEAIGEWFDEDTLDKFMYSIDMDGDSIEEFLWTDLPETGVAVIPVECEDINPQPFKPNGHYECHQTYVGIRFGHEQDWELHFDVEVGGGVNTTPTLTRQQFIQAMEG